MDRHYAPTVSSPTSLLKRLILGRPFRSDRLGHTLLPKRIALPVFASDPLSSVAYATQEILLILTLGGLAYLYLTPWIASAVVLLLAVVVLSYRQVVRAYPSGGGSYEVASTNLGARAGLVVAAALLVDYVMTVAVSVAAGVDNIISAIPELNPYRIAINIGFVVLLTAMNLRGVRESGRTFAIPTYAFVVGVLSMIANRTVPRACSATRRRPRARVTASTPNMSGLNTLALALLALRAFSSGCTALTGVEAISNGVPAFRKPKATQRRSDDGGDGRPVDHDVRRRHRAGPDRTRSRTPKTPATSSDSPATAVTTPSAPSSPRSPPRCSATTA